MTDTSREAVAAAVAFLRQDMHEGRKAGGLLEAVAEERDEALANIARIQSERAEFVAGVEALAGVLKGERDEALAREAALREALTRAADDLSLYARHGITAFHGERAARDALTATATAAAVRDAALVERGRREGIERAAQKVVTWAMDECPDPADEAVSERLAEAFNDHPARTPMNTMLRARAKAEAEAIRALATPPAKENDDG